MRVEETEGAERCEEAEARERLYSEEETVVVFLPQERDSLGRRKHIIFCVEKDEEAEGDWEGEAESFDLVGEEEAPCYWSEEVEAARERERERRALQIRPIRDLHESELLALLLGAGGRQQAKAQAEASRLWARWGSLRAFERAGVAEIAEAGEMDEERALAVKAALEMGRRLAQIPLERGEAYVCSRQIWRAFGAKLAGLEQETFWILLLDQGNRLIHQQQICVGAINRCPVTPLEVFSPVLREKAVSLILLHNHPSGHPEPSPEDRALTEQLQRVAKLLGVRLLDHLVIGDQRYVSFADRGWL